MIDSETGKTVDLKLAKFYSLSRRVGMYGTILSLILSYLIEDKFFSYMAFYASVGFVVATPLMRTIYLAAIYRKGGAFTSFTHSMFTIFMFILLVLLKILNVI